MVSRFSLSRNDSPCWPIFSSSRPVAIAAGPRFRSVLVPASASGKDRKSRSQPRSPLPFRLRAPALSPAGTRHRRWTRAAECALADCANERAFLSGFYLALSTWRRMCSPEHILSALPGNAYGAMRSVSVSLWKAVWSRKRSQPPAFLPVCATLFFSFVAKSSHEL